MLRAWPPLRQTADDELLGAETWLNPLVRRCNWCYGQAHAPLYPFRQAWCEPAHGVYAVWQGELPYDAAHTTLYFSGWVDNDADGTFSLQVYADAGGGDDWQTLATDSANQDGAAHYFGESQWVNYDVSTAGTGYDYPDDIIRARLISTDNASTDRAYGFMAYLTGTTGFTTWPVPLPTFTDGAGNEPDYTDFNDLRDMSSYDYECAQKPNLHAATGTASHTQPDAYGELYRWAFRADGRQRLHLEVTVSNYQLASDVILYIDAYNYYSGSGFARTEYIDGELNANGSYTKDIDISASLTVGDWFAVELGVLNTNTGSTQIAVTDIYLYDLAGTARTYTPSTFSHGDQVAAADLTLIKNDLNEMYPDAANESPIWLEHMFATNQLNTDADGGTLISSYRYSAHKTCCVRRWRYLKWRGAGKLVSADGSYETSLSDAATAGDLQSKDLDDVAWLDYGMEYTVQDSDANHIIVAYEDYA